MKRKHQWIWTIATIIIGVILFIFMNDQYFKFIHGFPVFMNLLLIFLAAYICVIIHELGHFVFGKILGYQFLAIKLFNLMWLRQNGRIKFSFTKLHNYGACMMVPPPYVLSDGKYILFFSGGILLSAVLGLFIYLFQLFYLGLPVWLYILSIYLIFFSLLFNLINLMPFYSNNNPTDGTLIWSLVFKRPYAKEMLESANQMARLSAGVRPRDLLITPESNRSKINLSLMLYFKFLDSGVITSAAKVMSEIEQRLDEVSSMMLPSIHYELCYIGCITNDTNRAKYYYEKGGKVLKNDMDANGMRVKAYYEYYVNRNPQQALIYAERVLAVHTMFPIKGQAVMESNLAEKLIDIIKSAQNP